MLIISNVSKRFGGKKVLDGINLDVPPGRAAAALGANGSGKTTLLRITAGILSPDSGSVSLFGISIRDTGAFKRMIGYVCSDENSFYPFLTARQNLEFFAGIYGSDRVYDEVADYAERLGAGEFFDVNFCHLSKGNRQKFSFLRAFLGRPRAVLADETNSLDGPSAAAAGGILREFVKKGGIVLAAGKTIFDDDADTFIIKNGALTRP